MNVTETLDNNDDDMMVYSFTKGKSQFDSQILDSSYDSHMCPSRDSFNTYETGDEESTFMGTMLNARALKEKQ